MANVNTLDPIQGFDVDVTVKGFNGPILVGRFTSILVRVVNVTETYLELNQRVPRHLDGEINIVWQMERGMLNMQALEQTFGFFAGGQQASISRQDKVKRAVRFSISFEVSVKGTDFSDPDMAELNGQIVTPGRTTYGLDLCKVDTMSFGATSGRNIVANQWQGTAEGLRIY